MIGYPFDSRVVFDSQGKPQYDRAVSALPMRRLIKKLLTDGVLPNPSTNLQVGESEQVGMTVVVSPGFCIVNGCMKLEEDARTLSVTAADPNFDRIDTVVMRLNDNTDVRTCDLYISKGIAGAEPVRPNLTETESIHEIGLADLYIPSGATTITNERITDTRYEDERCGVISSIAEFDTDTIYQQVQADLSSFKANEQQAFLVWFEEMKGQLSEDAAGHLQNEIDELTEKIDNNYFPPRMMASNLPIGYVASASSELDDEHAAWKAFSNDENEGWTCAENEWENAYLQIELPEPRKVCVFSCVIQNEETTINTMDFQASNDGITWTTVANGRLGEGQTGRFIWKCNDGVNEYKYYRVVVRSLHGSGNKVSFYGVKFYSTNVNNSYHNLISKPRINGVELTSGSNTSTMTSVDLKIDNINRFNIAVSDWQGNTDTSTNTDYPYIAVKSSTIYSNNSQPIWQMNGVGTIPTSTERDEISKVLEAVFTSSGITLYANEQPTVALVLEVKGVY